MRFIEFEDSKGNKVFLNPVNIAYIKFYKEERTTVYFNSTLTVGLTYITVKGSVEQTASKLQIN